MMNTNTALTFPTVHLNGTSRIDLQEQYHGAYMALQDALVALRQSCPNGRDYYPQGPEAFRKAVAEQESRIERLEAIQTEVKAIYASVIADLLDGGK